MDPHDLFKKRCSVRTYASREVSKEVLLSILGAATWAPSAHNVQPWRFIVITDITVKRKLAEAMANCWDADLSLGGIFPEKRASLVKTSVERFTRAAVIVIVCMTMENTPEWLDKKRRKIEHIMAIQSVAAAIENMLLAAHIEGLGSCWCCAPLFCQATVRKILKIPSFIEPQALVTLGYPVEWPKPAKRKTVEEITYRNYWGQPE